MRPSTRIRTYSELSLLTTLEERFRYLHLRGSIGEATFGAERYLNQRFYRSAEWKHIRHAIIVRDNGCDLGVDGFELHEPPYIHHLNPMTVDDIRSGSESILDPENLICVSLRTHNAIHYGEENQLRTAPVVRRPGDTKLW